MPPKGGWQDYALSVGKGLTGLPFEEPHSSRALGVLGMPGFTACMGLLDIGRPAVGETVVVAAASGAVGSIVGQIAKIKGCHVVGIAGGEDKCRYAVDKLGFDFCADHRADDLPGRLAAACPTNERRWEALRLPALREFREVAALAQARGLQLGAAGAGSQVRPRQPLRLLTRSGFFSSFCYGSGGISPGLQQPSTAECQDLAKARSPSR